MKILNQPSIKEIYWLLQSKDLLFVVQLSWAKMPNKVPYVWGPIARSVASSAALKSSQNCPGCSSSKQTRNKCTNPCQLPEERRWAMCSISAKKISRQTHPKPSNFKINSCCALSQINIQNVHFYPLNLNCSMRLTALGLPGQEIFNNHSTDTFLDINLEILRHKTSQILAYLVIAVTSFFKCSESFNNTL